MPQAANASSCNNNFLLGPASPTVRISAATVGSIHESPANLDARSDILRRDRRPRLSAPSVTRSGMFHRDRRHAASGELSAIFHNLLCTCSDRRGRRSLRTDGLHVRGPSGTPVPTNGRFTYPRTVEDAGPYRQTVCELCGQSGDEGTAFYRVYLPPKMQKTEPIA